jgi:hypothetical protein
VALFVDNLHDQRFKHCKSKLMIMSSDDAVIEDVEEITLNRGDTHSYLGMEFQFSDGQVKITMKGYIDSC